MMRLSEEDLLLILEALCTESQRTAEMLSKAKLDKSSEVADILGLITKGERLCWLASELREEHWKKREVARNTKSA